MYRGRADLPGDRKTNNERSQTTKFIDKLIFTILFILTVATFTIGFLGALVK